MTDFLTLDEVGTGVDTTQMSLALGNLWLTGGYPHGSRSQGMGVWVHQQAGYGLMLRRSSKRYRTREAQALADLRASGWFSWGTWAVHRLAKWAIRSLPLDGIQYLYAHLRKTPAVATPVPFGWYILLEKARSWSPPA